MWNYDPSLAPEFGFYCFRCGEGWPLTEGYAVEGIGYLCPGCTDIYELLGREKFISLLPISNKEENLRPDLELPDEGLEDHLE